jgi:hypothetical protein
MFWMSFRDENYRSMLKIKVVEELFRLQNHKNGIFESSLFLTSRERGNIKEAAGSLCPNGYHRI